MTVPPIVSSSDRVVMTKISELREHPLNPRESDMDAIKASIKRLGFYGAVLVQKSTGTVIAGWHRSQAYAELGGEFVPVLEADVSDDDALVILAADNKTAARGGFSLAKLAELLQEMGDTAHALTGSGYTNDDLADALRASGGFGSAATGFLGGDSEGDPTPEDQRDGGDGSPKQRPEPDNPREPLFSLAYTVTGPQRETIFTAIKLAKDALGDSRDSPVTSTAALVEICRRFPLWAK